MSASWLLYVQATSSLFTLDVSICNRVLYLLLALVPPATRHSSYGECVWEQDASISAMEAKTVVRRAEWFELNHMVRDIHGKGMRVGQQKAAAHGISRLSEVNLKDDGDPRVFLHLNVTPRSLPKLLLN